MKYAECVFSSVYHIFLPYLPSSLSDREIYYAKPAPYFSPRALCLDLSMYLGGVWVQHADHAGVTAALLICQTTGCAEK